MELETLFNKHYEDLNTNDKAVMQQIITNQVEYQTCSCEQIATSCNISRATLLRICRKIGLQSFADLKYMLKDKHMNAIESISDFHTICEDYHLLINELRKVKFESICEHIYKAETIYIYGTGNEQKSLAEELKRIFLTVGKCVIDLYDYGEINWMKEQFCKDDVFIIISLSGETKEGIEIIKFIKPFIHTLSLTRLQNNTISSLCEQNLYVATQMLEGIQVSSYELVGVFYALLDFLFINYIAYINKIKAKDKEDR